VVLALCVALAAGCANTDGSSPNGSSSDSPAAPAPIARANARAACDLYASPQGSRGAPGSRARPLGSLARLLRRLRPGRVGCLMAGRYRHRGVVEMRRPRTTLRALGGAPVTVDGALWVLPGAKGARIAGLSLTSHDREFAIPLKVQADGVTIAGNDITSGYSISCVLVGSSRHVSGLVIERNRIHQCGRSGKHDHLIYMVQTRGAVIRDNVLVDNAGGWAVHLYPDADGTLIEGNVIDGNEGGVVFAGDGNGDTSDGNTVRANVITNSSPRWNVEGSWSGGPRGAGNRAVRNCLFTTGPGAPAGIGYRDGFVASRNVLARGQLYISRSSGDYRLGPGSSCKSVVRQVAGAGAGPRR
jgi:hypothetical protein